MKKLTDKLFDEIPPAAHRQKVLNAAKAELEGDARSSSLFRWLFHPAAGVSFAAAALAILLVFSQKAREPAEVVAYRPDPEMVRDAELLYDLKVLRNYEALEKIGKRKWPKKKS